MSRRRRTKLSILGLFVLILGGAAFWFYRGTRALSPNDPKTIFVRYESPTRLGAVLANLEKRGIIRNQLAVHLLAYIERRGANVPIGTYLVGAGMDAEAIIRSLRHPIRQALRLPETNWAKRTANLLEKHDVADAVDYMDLVHNPKQFSDLVTFPLPSDSLEGYLYPDTYDLPPLLGAKKVVERQLKTFEKKVWEGPERPTDMHRTLTLASLIQLEAGKDADRPMIAGVIENRIAKKMPLQIDATIEYALQKWIRLHFKDYHGVKSPYNTYLVKGLPPGPICSPDEKDILAAMHPAKHNYLYYVALPDGSSIYAATYPEHLKNIERRKAALKALGR